MEQTVSASPRGQGNLNMPAIARRDFLRASLPFGAAAVVAGPLVQSLSAELFKTIREKL